MKTNEAYVYFAFYGEDFDPDALTQFLGIEPTDAWKKGTRLPEHGLPKADQWRFSSEKMVDEFIDIYDLSSQLIAQLKPKAP